METFNFFRGNYTYTLLEINTLIKDHIRKGFPHYIWVCGEIQDLRLNRKHIYLNLVQKDPLQEEVVAQIKGIIFENDKEYIFRKLKEAEEPFELKDDIEIRILCKVDFYPKFGEFRLIIVDIDPVYTLGKVFQMRQRIIEELKRKGLMDKNKLVPLSMVPLNIGLITSYNSAAYHDFITELQNSGFGFRVYLFDAHMQGKNVEREITTGIDYFNRMRDVFSLDLIVITRGGGSSADLGWFDNFKIAEKIANSLCPILSAIGHEINVTVTDLVANRYFKTPTKIAQFLVEEVRTFLEKIEELKTEIINEVQDVIENNWHSLRENTEAISHLIQEYFWYNKKRLIEKYSEGVYISKMVLERARKDLLRYKDIYSLQIDNILKNKRTKLDNLEATLDALNPQNVLKRGYSLTLKEGKVVKSIREINTKDRIITKLWDGEIGSLVENIKE